MLNAHRGSIEYGTVGYTKGQVLGGRWKPLHHWYKAFIYADVMATCGNQDAEGGCDQLYTHTRTHTAGRAHCMSNEALACMYPELLGFGFLVFWVFWGGGWGCA
eukprot:COSAG05_NODE_1183_length_5592_cov_2.043328_3_plen_104_part_00